MEDVLKEGKEKKTYELALLLKSEADFARIAEILKQHSGELVGEPRPKNVALSYKIKGHTEAVFVSCLFHAMSNDAKALEEDLTTRDAAIRFMIMIAPKDVESRPAIVPAFGEEARRKPGTFSGAGPGAPREPKAPPREPLSNEALENLLKKI